MEHVAMHHGAATGRTAPDPRLHAGDAGHGFAHPLMAPRRAWTDDAAAIEAHLLRLDLADRNLRFCGAIGEASLRRHAVAVAGGNPLSLVALAPGGGWRVRAMIVIAPMDDDIAEVALSVESPWRGSGVAAGLMRAAAGVCARRGIRRMMALTLPENGAMQGLGLKLGGRLRRGPDGIEIHFDVGDLLALTSIQDSPWAEPRPAWRPAFGFGFPRGGARRKAPAGAGVPAVTASPAKPGRGALNAAR
ncbi:GNAT family N-acetyltransferase [Albimonas donghaensis]|nr:GNAT family N-acetyltransferase [Albimonas donghaensis]